MTRSPKCSSNNAIVSVYLRTSMYNLYGSYSPCCNHMTVSSTVPAVTLSQRAVSIISSQLVSSQLALLGCSFHQVTAVLEHENPMTPIALIASPRVTLRLCLMDTGLLWFCFDAAILKFYTMNSPTRHQRSVHFSFSRSWKTPRYGVFEERWASRERAIVVGQKSPCSDVL